MNTINKSIKDALFRAYNTRNRNNKNQKRFDNCLLDYRKYDIH